MAMKRIYFSTFLVFLSVFIFGCNIHNSKSFEGIITYEIGIVFNDEEVKINDGSNIISQYGNIAKLYIYSNGDLHREYPNSGDSGLLYNGYSSLKNNTYSKWKNYPEVLTSQSESNSLIYIDSYKGDTMSILNRNCNSILFLGLNAQNNDTITQQFYYDSTLYYDSDLLKGYNDFFTHDIYQKMMKWEKQIQTIII
jgi:hypothetical protein